MAWYSFGLPKSNGDGGTSFLKDLLDVSRESLRKGIECCIVTAYDTTGFTLYLFVVSCFNTNGVAYIVLPGSRCEANVILCSVVILLAVLRIGSVELSCQAVELLLLPLLLLRFET